MEICEIAGDVVKESSNAGEVDALFRRSRGGFRKNKANQGRHPTVAGKHSLLGPAACDALT